KRSPPLPPPLLPYTTLFRSANAEPASCLAHIHHDRALRKIEHGREHAAIEEWHLGDAEHGDALLRGVPDRHQPARLQRNGGVPRSEEHTSELQSRVDLVCRL